MYAIRNRKKYDAIFIWQQMIAYILFEIKRFIPFKIPPVVFFTFIYNSDTIFRKYKKHMVGNALRYAKGIIWDSEEIADAVKTDFPTSGSKNHYVPTPIFEVVDDVPVDKSLDDPDYLKTLAQLDQPAWYQSSEDYARWAAEMLKAERATIERVGLLLK